MKIAVTGASGHVGNLLCLELLKEGHSVRALIHQDESSLESLSIEKMKGDVLDLDRMKQFCSGMDIVFHLAAIISIDGDRDGNLMKVNVEGPKNIVEACLFAKVKRLIHFSSIHAFRQTPVDQVLDESRGYVSDAAFRYDLSKSLGEQEVLKGIDRGLDAIILNPVGVLGPYDHKPSLMGKAILDFYHGKLPALVRGGFDWVDVRDVVRSSINAIERGKRGERYLISGSWRSIRDLMEMLSLITQKKAPLITAPPWLARLGIPFIKILSKITGNPPLYTKESIETLEQSNQRISSAKAENDLGHKPRALDETLRDAFEWFKERKIIQ